jgi:hypothetical protein
MLSQQEQMMERNGASPQQMQAVEQQRRMLQQQDQQLQRLYLAPGVTRANFGFALIASGDVAEGEQMVQQALKLRPEMANDPRFQHALQDALRRGGAAGGSDRDPYKYSGPGDSGPGNSGTSPYAPPPPGSDTGTPLAPVPPGTPGDTTNPPLAPAPPGTDQPLAPAPPGTDQPLAPAPPGTDQPLPAPPGADQPLPTAPGADQPLPTAPGADQPLPTAPGADQPGGKPGGDPSAGGGVDQRGKPHDDNGSSVWQWLLGATGLAAVWAAMKQYAEKTAANEKLKSSFDQDGIKFSDDRPFKAEKQTKAGEVDIDGKKVKFEEGDYIVTGPDGKKEVVAGKDFDARFKSNGQSEYLEKDASTVKAKKLTADTAYLDADGRTQTAKAGDWLVLKDGQLSSVKDAEFTNGFSKIDQSAAATPNPDDTSAGGGQKTAPDAKDTQPPAGSDNGDGGGSKKTDGAGGGAGGDTHNKDAGTAHDDQPTVVPSAPDVVSGIKLNQSIKINGTAWQVSGADGDSVILRSGTEADVLGNKLTKLDPSQFHEIKVDGMAGTFYRRNLKSSQDVYLATEGGMLVRVNDLQVRGANSDVVDALRQGKSEYTSPVRPRPADAPTAAAAPADPAPEAKINVGLSDADVHNYLDYVSSNVTAGSADYLSKLSDAAKSTLTNEFGWGQNGSDAYLGQALNQTSVVASDDLKSGSRLVVKDKSGAEIKIKEVSLDPANPSVTTDAGAKVALADLKFEIQLPPGASAADATRETLVRFSELKSRLTPADQLARTSSSDVTPQDFDARISALQKPSDAAAPVVSPEIASASGDKKVEINLNLSSDLKVTLDANGITIGGQSHSNVDIADQAIKQAETDLSTLQQSGEDQTSDAYKAKLATLQKNLTDLKELRPKLVAGDPQTVADVRGAMQEELPDEYSAAEGGRVPELGKPGGSAAVYMLLAAAALQLVLQYKKDRTSQSHVPIS